MPAAAPSTDDTNGKCQRRESDIDSADPEVSDADAPQSDMPPQATEADQTVRKGARVLGAREPGGLSGGCEEGREVRSGWQQSCRRRRREAAACCRARNRAREREGSRYIAQEVVVRVQESIYQVRASGRDYDTEPNTNTQQPQCYSHSTTLEWATAPSSRDSDNGGALTEDAEKMDGAGDGMASGTQTFTARRAARLEEKYGDLSSQEALDARAVKWTSSVYKHFKKPILTTKNDGSITTHFVCETHPSKHVDRSPIDESTGNLNRHVQACTPKKAPKTQMITGYAQGATYSYACVHFLLAMWIARRHRPFTIVEDPEFKELLRMLYVRVEIPSRVTVSRDLKDIFEDSRARVKAKLQGHTGEYLVRKIIELVREFGIVYKVLAVMCDNTSNNAKMLKEMSKLAPEFRGPDAHVQCFGHVINLVVKRYFVRTKWPRSWVEEALCLLRVEWNDRYQNTVAISSQESSADGNQDPNGGPSHRAAAVSGTHTAATCAARDMLTSITGADELEQEDALEEYLEVPIRTTQTDPLKFWNNTRINGTAHPALAQMALDILSISVLVVVDIDSDLLFLLECPLLSGPNYRYMMFYLPYIACATRKSELPVYSWVAYPDPQVRVLSRVLPTRVRVEVSTKMRLRAVGQAKEVASG
ncbi:hypothetical protein LXA43DRAFT_1064176 [Ganoderma leucocontextum]|nr:hypothetical protein LXA43DRAFT_1064176 [Ganoderma leucocontextum]